MSPKIKCSRTNRTNQILHPFTAPHYFMFSFPGTASGMLQQSKQAANVSLQLTHTMKYYYSIGKLPFEECPTYSLASASAFHSSLELFPNS